MIMIMLLQSIQVSTFKMLNQLLVVGSFCYDDKFFYRYQKISTPKLVFEMVQAPNKCLSTDDAIEIVVITLHYNLADLFVRVTVLS